MQGLGCSLRPGSCITGVLKVLPEENGQSEIAEKVNLLNELLFEVMQTIVDGECRNKALGHCEEMLNQIKILKELLK